MVSDGQTTRADALHWNTQVNSFCSRLLLLLPLPTSLSVPFHFLVHSARYARLLDVQSVHVLRMHHFASLLRAYRLDSHPSLRMVSPYMASRSEVASFHTSDYVDFLARISARFTRRRDSADTDANYYGIVEPISALTDEERALCTTYGFEDDCAVIPEAWNLVRATVGGTIRAVDTLRDAHLAHPRAPVTVMHWGGGRHHGDASHASGFCFGNDVAVGILRLLSDPAHAFKRVLYLDIDLHHGDGVEEAFRAVDSVLTCSFHHHAPGFFPGSGALHTDSDRSRKSMAEAVDTVGRDGRQRRCAQEMTSTTVAHDLHVFFLPAYSTSLCAKASMTPPTAEWSAPCSLLTGRWPHGMHEILTCIVSCCVFPPSSIPFSPSSSPPFVRLWWWFAAASTAWRQIACRLSTSPRADSRIACEFSKDDSDTV